MHHRQNTQDLLPLLALLTSTEGGIIGNDIGQNRSLLHRRQNIQGLLPLLALSLRANENSSALAAGKAAITSARVLAVLENTARVLAVQAITSARVLAVQATSASQALMAAA